MQNTIRILHLENDPMDANIVRTTLSKENLSCEIVGATSESEFLSALRQGNFDLILSEYEIESFHGLSALSVAQEKVPKVPFIFVSKPIGEERVAEALLNGAANYVLKGHLSRLGSAIRRVVDRCRPEISRSTLNDRKEDLRALLDVSHDSAFLLDTYGDLLTANERFTKNVGERLHKLRGRSVYGFLPHGFAKGFREHAAKVLRTGAHVHYEDRWLGSFIDTCITPLFGTDEQVVGLAVLVRDITGRKQVEESLVREDELIRTLMDHLPDYIFLKDAEGRFIMSNAAHLRVMGAKSLEEVKNKTDFDIFPKELAAQYYADEQTVINSGVPLIGREERVIDVDGNEHLLLTTKLPVRNEQGQIIGTFGVSRDITELKRVEKALRKVHEELELRVQERTAELALANKALRMEITERERMEAELRKSEEKYRTLFEGSKDIVFFSSPEGKFLDINRAGVELYGYDSKEQLLTIDFARDLYVYPQDRKIFQQELVKKGYVKDLETILKRKDGKELVVLETAIAVRDANGDVVAYQGITHDITERKQAEEALRNARDELELRVQERTAELAQANKALQMEIVDRKRAEEALRESEERYRTIFEESRDAIYVTSRDGKIIEMNPYALNLFGYTRGEMQGRKVQRLYVHPRDRLSFQKEIEEKGYLRDYEMKMRKKDGTEIDCLLTSAVWWAKDGSVQGYQGIIRDITERKKAEAELRNSRQMLREFSARIQAAREEEKRRIAREVHDELGQVLTGLKIDLFWLRSKLRGRSRSWRRSGDHQEEQKSILKKIKSILLLVNSAMRTVRKISTELRPVVLDDLGLLEAIEWQVQEFESRTGIRCETRSDLQETRSLDPDRATAVFRIFQETLTNVARHANASKVVVTLNEQDGNLMMSVRDNGRGITDSKISSPKSLGLMGMRERAYLLGGDIEVVGSSGGGTVVTVRLPRLEKEIE